MLKKSITFKDYNGLTRTEDFYFNLTQAEITETDLSTAGGMIAKYERMTQKVDGKTIIATLKEYILKSYGEKSADGRNFIKVRDGHHLSEDFEQTPAYDILFMELVNDANAAAAFLSAIVPAEMGEKMKELAKEREGKVVTLPSAPVDEN